MLPVVNAGEVSSIHASVRFSAASSAAVSKVGGRLHCGLVKYCARDCAWYKFNSSLLAQMFPYSPGPDTPQKLALPFPVRRCGPAYQGHCSWRAKDLTDKAPNSSVPVYMINSSKPNPSPFFLDLPGSARLSEQQDELLSMIPRNEEGMRGGTHTAWQLPVCGKQLPHSEKETGPEFRPKVSS